MDGADQARVDRSALEHEGIEILDYRQLGCGHALADRGGIAMCRFRPQQVAQDLVGCALPLPSRGDVFIERAGHSLRSSPRISSIISCRCIEASHRVVAGAVRNRRKGELEIDGHVEGTLRCRLAV